MRNPALVVGDLTGSRGALLGDARSVSPARRVANAVLDLIVHRLSEHPACDAEGDKKAGAECEPAQRQSSGSPVPVLDRGPGDRDEGGDRGASAQNDDKRIGPGVTKPGQSIGRTDQTGGEAASGQNRGEDRRDVIA